MTTKGEYAVLGLTGSPVTIAHEYMAELALTCGHFSKVIVLPCAQNRSDKQIGVSSWHRWNMIYEGFRDLKERYGNRLIISNLFVHSRHDVVSLEQLKILNERDPRVYRLCVGSDLVEPTIGNEHISKVEAFWDRGKPLWFNAAWAIFHRPGSRDPKSFRLPPNAIVIEGDMPDVSSTLVRGLIAEGKPWEHLVPARAVIYIKKHSLYQGEN